MENKSNLSVVKTSTTFYTILFGILSLVGGLLMGFDIGAMTGAVLFIKNEFNLENKEIGAVVGAALLGCAFGALISAPLSKVLGRRSMIVLSTAIYLVSSLGLWFATNLNQLYFYRFTVGVGIGIASFAIPIYIAETASKEKRGAVVSIYQLAITLGILVAFCVGIYNANSLEWRPIFLFNSIVSFLFLFFIPLLPQSPRWLYQNGKPEKAFEVLKKIRSASSVDEEISEIADHVKVDKGGIKKYLIPIMIGVGMAVFQQVSGINGVIFFAPSIIHRTGILDQQVILTLTALIGLINFLSTLFCIFIIDRVGRRPLLLVGITGMFLSLVFLSLSEKTGFTVLSLMGYIASFAIGLGPLFWVICSEIFPMQVRGFGMSLATLINWFCSFIVSSTFLILTDHFTYPGTFLIYAAITALGFLFVYFFVPETKGLSLEKIEDFWGKPKKY